MEEDAKALAEAVRHACLEAAVAAYQQAGISGLCGEGRWEMAIRALSELDLDTVIALKVGGRSDSGRT
jgi:hypothetical protein